MNALHASPDVAVGGDADIVEDRLGIAGDALGVADIEMAAWPVSMLAKRVQIFIWVGSSK